MRVIRIFKIVPIFSCCNFTKLSAKMKMDIIYCVWEVVVCLNKKEIIYNVIKNNGGIARTSDFADKG